MKATVKTEQTAGFTPGPWKLGTEDYAYFETGGETVKHTSVGIDAEGAIDICRVTTGDWGEGNSNARLIACAPELLEALRGILGICNASPTGPFKPDIARICETAISKAERGQA